MAQKLISRINQRAHYSKNEDRPEVAELIKLIIKCMDEKEEFYLEEVKGLTRALLMQIARWNEKDETQEKNAILDDASIALILPALNYIGENFHESIRIEELADVCHISETHLRRIFSGIHADAAGGIYQLGSDPGSVQRAEKDKCLRK